MSNALITRRSGGGLAGSTLTVTASKAGTITIKQQGTTKKREKKVAAADNYTAVFKGLDAGIWEVTHDANPAVVKEVTIGESIVISTFVAWIKVTYPSGSTCTCTLYDADSGEEIKADVIEQSSGYYKFEVHQEGTWRVYCSNSSKQEKWEDVYVADGQTKTVSLSYTFMVFSANNQCKDVTGGWSYSGYTIPSGYLGCTYRLASAGDKISAAALNNGLARTSNIIGTVNKVKLKSYNTLTCDVSLEFGGLGSNTISNYGRYYIAISTTKSFSPSASSTIALKQISTTKRQTVTLPLANCTSDDGYYIIVAALNNGAVTLWYQEDGALGNPSFSYIHVYSMKVTI